jgi:hypothetical protein
MIEFKGGLDMSDAPVVETDRCVNCGKDTGIPTKTSVDRREHYIEGAGQLCHDCCHGLYPHHCKCSGEMPFGVGISDSGRIVIG